MCWGGTHVVEVGWQVARVGSLLPPHRAQGLTSRIDLRMHLAFQQRYPLSHPTEPLFWFLIKAYLVLMIRPQYLSIAPLIYQTPSHKWWSLFNNKPNHRPIKLSCSHILLPFSLQCKDYNQSLYLWSLLKSIPTWALAYKLSRAENRQLGLWKIELSVHHPSWGWIISH